MTMQYRRFGRTELQIPVFSCGGMRYQQSWKDEELDVITPENQAAKAGTAAFIAMHSYDHYGQMVVYARLNGVTPGGGPPPAAPKGKAKGK